MHLIMSVEGLKEIQRTEVQIEQSYRLIGLSINSLPMIGPTWLIIGQFLLGNGPLSTNNTHRLRVTYYDCNDTESLMGEWIA